MSGNKDIISVICSSFSLSICQLDNFCSPPKCSVFGKWEGIHQWCLAATFNVRVHKVAKNNNIISLY